MEEIAKDDGVEAGIRERKRFAIISGHFDLGLWRSRQFDVNSDTSFQRAKQSEVAEQPSIAATHVEDFLAIVKPACEPVRAEQSGNIVAAIFPRNRTTGVCQIRSHRLKPSQGMI